MAEALDENMDTGGDEVPTDVEGAVEGSEAAMEMLRNSLLYDAPMQKASPNRSIWTDESALGRGISLTLKQYRDTAVVYKPTELPDAVVNPTYDFRLVSTTSEFTEFLQAAASGSFSANLAGVSGSASFSMEVASSFERSSTAVTAIVLQQFKSEPLIAIQPGNREQDVKLNSAAMTLLVAKVRTSRLLFMQ
jgi:hypothetical protein